MRNINKIKELKEDRYTIILDNKQVVSIIFSTISLGIILFFTGYFIGKETAKTEKLKNEIKTKNIAIINRSNDSESLKKKKIAKDIKREKSLEDEKVSENSEKKVNADDGQKELVENNGEVKTPEEKNNNKKEKNKNKDDDVNTELKEKENLVKKDNNEKKVIDKEFKTSLKSEAEGKYVLQILATPKIKEAEELKNSLIKSGYQAFIEKVESKGVVYNRVRIGFFKTSEEAKKFKADFEKESGIKKTFITKRK